MSRFLVVAIGGAGGDLPPLIAAALALRGRGHETVFVGDRSVERTLAGLGVEARVLPSELDLGPRLIGAIREAMAATGGDLGSAGPVVEERLTAWARDVAPRVSPIVAELRPGAVVTSLFGVEVLEEAAPPCPGRRQQHVLHRTEPASAGGGGHRAEGRSAGPALRAARGV